MGDIEFDILAMILSQVSKNLFICLGNSVYQNEKHKSIKKALVKKVNQSYGTFFFKLSQDEKNSLLKYIPFVISYCVIKVHLSVFPSSREYFDKEFGLKIIKLVFYILQGVTVTDVYIQKFITRHFSEDIRKLIFVNNHHFMCSNFT